MSNETEMIKGLLSGVDDATKAKLLMDALERTSKKGPTAFTDSRVTAVELEKKYKQLMSPVELAPGQLVKWKPGLKNKRRPEVGEPAIVIEVLKTPLFDETEGAGSPYFREPLDVILGVFDEDEDFDVFYFDSRRMEPFESQGDSVTS